ncbi:hypothetical protein GCM10023339_18390 [Alloalcanivorax gelatiniphagus]
MADGTPDDGPSLEMPSFSLRRRKAAEAHADAPPAQAPEPTPVAEREPAPAPPAAPRARRQLPSVSLGGLPAAALTGLLVGGLAVLIAWLAGAGCTATRGTSSCGGAAGLPILLAALVVMAYAGALLLRVLGVADAGSTSLLAVGVLAVLVMVFLLGPLDEWWAVVAVPVASVVAYLGSWWVTAVVVADEEPIGARTPYDVR